MRALISVSNKKNIVEFAKGLCQMEWDIVSTGGTYEYLKDHGISVEEVSSLTGFPEILDGRVKTIHPHVAAAILYQRKNPDHVKCMQEKKLKDIDMVVCQLYPFEESLTRNFSFAEMMEMIDIGGVTLIRAAAKNFQDVLVITDEEDYELILSKIQKGNVTLEDRKRLAKKAFQMIAHYDAVIAEYFSQGEQDEPPSWETLTFGEKKQLRYGENPHQKAYYYKNAFPRVKWNQIHGKELSFNNLKDMDSAFSMIQHFCDNAVIAIKHNTPCGIAMGKSVAEAYEKAYRCDRESIFGGIVICNGEVDKETAKMMSEIFLEIILAPGFQKEALEILQQKKNIRLITYEIPPQGKKISYAPTMDGLLVQEEDCTLWNEEEVECFCEETISKSDWKEIEFAVNCAKCVSSNGVVITKNGATIGIGQGQTKRAWSVEEAISRAGKQIENSVFASDGFFFTDTMELLKDKKIQYILSPGGSIHDQEVIQMAKKLGMPLIFTHQRHFRH